MAAVKETNIDRILQAINLAQYDPDQERTVHKETLNTLRKEIEILRDTNKRLYKEIKYLNAKLSLSILDRPPKLEIYC